jgi:hypothetical protein
MLSSWTLRGQSMTRGADGTLGSSGCTVTEMSWQMFARSTSGRSSLYEFSRNDAGGILHLGMMQSYGVRAATWQGCH